MPVIFTFTSILTSQGKSLLPHIQYCAMHMKKNYELLQDIEKQYATMLVQQQVVEPESQQV